MQEYKLRAECQIDIARMLAAAIEVRAMTYECPDDGFADVEIRFTSSQSLAEIKRALRKIVDGHVMAETVQLSQNYTGERA